MKNFRSKQQSYTRSVCVCLRLILNQVENITRGGAGPRAGDGADVAGGRGRGVMWERSVETDILVIQHHHHHRHHR